MDPTVSLSYLLYDRLSAIYTQSPFSLIFPTHLQNSEDTFTPDYTNPTKNLKKKIPPEDCIYPW